MPAERQEKYLQIIGSTIVRGHILKKSFVLPSDYWTDGGVNEAPIGQWEAKQCSFCSCGVEGMNECNNPMWIRIHDGTNTE
mmetsp:Transcript_19183/g.40089  ORF Transcript_19183/g.40089 Transcript_19183/m.40089 type:complete len:81 (-) Transcript_19183:77-319(-)